MRYYTLWKNIIKKTKVLTSNVCFNYKNEMFVKTRDFYYVFLRKRDNSVYSSYIIT